MTMPYIKISQKNGGKIRDSGKYMLCFVYASCCRSAILLAAAAIRCELERRQRDFFSQLLSVSAADGGVVVVLFPQLHNRSCWIFSPLARPPRAPLAALPHDTHKTIFFRLNHVFSAKKYFVSCGVFFMIFPRIIEIRKTGE